MPMFLHVTLEIAARARPYINLKGALISSTSAGY